MLRRSSRLRHCLRGLCVSGLAAVTLAVPAVASAADSPPAPVSDTSTAVLRLPVWVPPMPASIPPVPAPLLAPLPTTTLPGSPAPLPFPACRCLTVWVELLTTS